MAQASVLLNQEWTLNLALAALFACLGSFQLGFNVTSFGSLRSLVRSYVKNETSVAYILSSAHFRAMRLLDDFRIDADSVELFGRRFNLTVMCALKEVPAVRGKLDAHMRDLLDFICRMHFDTENMCGLVELMFIVGALVGAGNLFPHYSYHI